VTRRCIRLAKGSSSTSEKNTYLRGQSNGPSAQHGGDGSNVHDKHLLEDLLAREDRRVYGDNAYASQRNVVGKHAPQA
jgi:hypothetical protein